MSLTNQEAGWERWLGAYEAEACAGGSWDKKIENPQGAGEENLGGVAPTVLEHE